MSDIEGFDDETAAEIQARANEYLENLAQQQNEERIALGVSDDLLEISGLTMAMLVALGKDDVKTIEDLAGCATDDLVGWTERKNGEVKRFNGCLSGFDISRQEAEDIIMLTRVAAGWIDPSELLSEEEAAEYETLEAEEGGIEGEELLEGEELEEQAIVEDAAPEEDAPQA